MRELYEEILQCTHADGTTLSARFAIDEAAPSDMLAVLLPPHPILGGDADNNVIRALHEHLTDSGVATLRINFRGTDDAPVLGMHALTYWEKLDEADDYTVIGEDLNLLMEQSRKIRAWSKVHLIGYSFGAVPVLRQNWANCQRLVISPPLAAHDLEADLARFDGVLVYGANDPFCPDGVVDLAENARNRLKLPVSDHFFRGEEAVLTAQISGLLND